MQAPLVQRETENTQPLTKEEIMSIVRNLRDQRHLAREKLRSVDERGDRIGRELREADVRWFDRRIAGLLLWHATAEP